jgi:hypothetical protein
VLSRSLLLPSRSLLLPSRSVLLPSRSLVLPSSSLLLPSRSIYVYIYIMLTFFRKTSYQVGLFANLVGLSFFFLAEYQVG